MAPYDSIFSKQRVEDTLSYGYLEMLGALSKTQRGIEWVCFIELGGEKLLTTKQGSWSISSFTRRSTTSVTSSSERISSNVLLRISTTQCELPDASGSLLTRAP
jgi:thiamine pyrophosphokinase